MIGTLYVLKLMFEWGGGCLWCANAAAVDQFGVGPIEDRLPLTTETRRRLDELSAWHNQALNWDYPPDPSPWTAVECECFGNAAGVLLSVIRAELGADFEVIYREL